MEVEYRPEGPDHLVWTPDGIGFRFSRVHESHEDITAMCRVSLWGFPGHQDGDLFDGRVILTGPRSKADCVKACRDRLPEFDDWYGLVEKACQRVRRALEEGTPIIRIDTLGEDDPPPPYVVEPFIREQESTLLFGLGGTAKSSMGLQWAASAPGKTLYLDYEDEDRTIRRRLRGLARGGAISGNPTVYYKRAEQSLPQICDALARQIAAERIDGLVVDSAGLACGAEPERADSANAYFRALRLLGTQWSLTIAHQTKGKLASDYPFGSVYWWNNPRSIWQSRSTSEEGAPDLHVGLWHRKNNNGPLSAAIGFHVSYPEGAVQLQREPPRTHFRENVSQRERVLAVFEDMPAVSRSYEELAEATGIPMQSLYVVLPRLGKDGLVRKDGEGSFRLVHEESPAEPPYWAT